MVRMLWKTLQECQRDTSVAAVIIRGAGDRAFCAGKLLVLTIFPLFSYVG